MKMILTILLGVLGLSTMAQNADPYLSLQTEPPVITLGSNTTLKVVTGNVGNGRIISGSMSITIKVGQNAQIIAALDTMNRWHQKSLSKGLGNSLILINAGTVPFSSFDVNQVNIIIKGVALGGPIPISGSIDYLPGNNALLGGRAKSSQGNANIANDNSLTSLTVTPQNSH